VFGATVCEFMTRGDCTDAVIKRPEYKYQSSIEHLSSRTVQQNTEPCVLEGTVPDQQRNEAEQLLAF